MYDVPIPDDLYKQAAEAALAHHVSLEAFVAEAVQLRLLDTPGSFDNLFTADVLAAIDKGAQEAREGKSLTMEQVDAHFAAKRKAWQEKLAD
jgi:hypothetical protein